jgi:hypothetical protein
MFAKVPTYDLVLLAALALVRLGADELAGVAEALPPVGQVEGARVAGHVTSGKLKRQLPNQQEPFNYS